MYTIIVQYFLLSVLPVYFSLYILNLPVNGRQTVLLQKLIGLAEMPAPEKSPVSGQRTGMGRFQNQVLSQKGGVNPVHLWLQREIDNLRCGSSVADGEKTNADIAGKHIPETLYIAGAAGQRGGKVFSKKAVAKIPETGSF